MGIGLAVLVLSGTAALLLVLIVGPCYVGALPLPSEPLCVDRYWGNHLVPLALLLATGGGLLSGLLRGGRAARRQFGDAARLGKTLRLASVPAGPDLQRAALAACPDQSVARCATEVPLAITVGCRRPMVLVSDGLLRLLTGTDLAAVLSHEAAHCRSRDPLRLGVVRTAAQLGGCLPVLREIATYAALTAELEADRCASERYGRAAVASALRSLLGVGAPEPALAVGSIASSLPERVAALGGRPPRFRASPAALAWSTAAVTIATWTMSTAARLLMT